MKLAEMFNSRKKYLSKQTILKLISKMIAQNFTFTLTHNCWSILSNLNGSRRQRNILAHKKLANLPVDGVDEVFFNLRNVKEREISNLLYGSFLNLLTWANCFVYFNENQRNFL